MIVRKEGKDVKITVYKSRGAYVASRLLRRRQFSQEIDVQVEVNTKFYQACEGQPDSEIIVNPKIPLPVEIGSH